MRVLVLIVSILIAPLAWADAQSVPGQRSPEKAARLDALFSDLKAAPNEQAAHAVEQKIWVEWTNPQDPELAKLVDQALRARRVSDYDKALSILDRVIEGWNAYAEGWNQRATIYYLKGDYDKSLADIDQTLAREPRHFGALAGQGVIYLQKDKPDLAEQSILRALEFYPYLPERGLIKGLTNQGGPL